MISKEELLKEFSTKKAKDYTYAIIFFLTFSFFTFFVIKPNITTVVALEKELKELKEIDLSYSNVIDKIINLQTSVEKTRETVGVLGEALPARPQVNQLIEDIRRSSSESGMIIGKLTISEINLKNKSEKSGYKKIRVDLTSQAGFEEANKFILSLFEQRRIKSVNDITISKDTKESTASATINVKLLVEGYYL